MIDPSNIPPPATATHGKHVRNSLNVPFIPTLPSTPLSSLPNPFYLIPIQAGPQLMHPLLATALVETEEIWNILNAPPFPFFPLSLIPHTSSRHYTGLGKIKYTSITFFPHSYVTAIHTLHVCVNA